MKKLKSGMTVIVTGGIHPSAKKMAGTIHILGEKSQEYDSCWRMNPATFADSGNELSRHEKRIIPIEDSGGQDETLTWAPVPNKVEA